jgi:sec-independent protein translocase protein TatA
MYNGNVFGAFAFLGQEALLVVVIVLVLFGGSKLPELMRGLGKGIDEFKNGLEEGRKSE